MKKSSTAATKWSRNISQPNLTIGFDLGDRHSLYCVLDEASEVQSGGTVGRAHHNVSFFA